MSAINQGKPLSQVVRKASVTQSIREMADYLVQEDKGDNKKRPKRFK